MVVRLLLALLLAALATPVAAPAACHDAPVARHIVPMPADGSDRQAPPAHVCIGCIPPSDWLGPSVNATVMAPVATPLGAIAALIPGPSPSLDPPPPRLA